MRGSPRLLPCSAPWLSLLLAVLLLVSACRAPSAVPESDGIPGELGIDPLPLDEEDLPPDLPTAEASPEPTSAAPQTEATPDAAPAAPTASPDQPPADPPAEDVDPDPETQATPPPPAGADPGDDSTPRVVGTAADARGDHGREGPAYADILQVTIEEHGTSAMVTIDMAADIPARLGEGEVMGVGVDLYRDPSRDESDFQVFADGSEGGWLAYLHTPTGFVEYPGTFHIGGRRMRFEVSWSAVGGMSSGGFRAFADWSQRRLVLNAVSQDFAPDQDPASFAR